MNNIWVNVIYGAVRIIVGSGLFDRSALLVKELIGTDLPGEEKKQQVREFLQRERANVSGILLDGLIFAARLKFEWLEVER